MLPPCCDTAMRIGRVGTTVYVGFDHAAAIRSRGRFLAVITITALLALLLVYRDAVR